MFLKQNLALSKFIYGFLAIYLGVLILLAPPVFCADQRKSASFNSQVEPGQCKTYSFRQDGRYTDVLKIPTYEWVPEADGQKVRAVAIFVHGFTMHGRRFSQLAEIFAANNIYGVAYDMYGFGRNFYTEKKPLVDGIGSKRRINYGKSHKQLVKLIKLVKQDHPGLPVYLIGESLGATPCLKIAIDEPGLTDGIVLSAPAVQINPLLFAHPMSAIEATIPVVFSPHLNMRLNHFVNSMLTHDSEIKADIRDDDEIRRSVTWIDLVRTQTYVAKALLYAPKIKNDIPILFLVGGKDLVVLPSDSFVLYGLLNTKNKQYVKLKKRSHLLTETRAIKPDTVETILGWINKRQLEVTPTN